MKELISVIVPVYNVEEYLEECIESLIKQSYEQCEIILVDDGSTDKSGRICDSYANRDARIKVIHKENGGLSSARNAGLDIMQGEYIAFVDSDDFVHVDYLKDMKQLAQKYEADLVCCHFTQGESCVWPEQGVDKEVVRRGKDILNKMNEDDVTITVVWNKLYKAEFFKKYALRFEIGKIHEDMFMTPQVLNLCKVMVISDKQLYYYRIRSNSIMTSAFSVKRLQIFEALEFRIDFLKKNGNSELYHAEIENYIRKLLQYIILLRKENKREYYIYLKQLKKKAWDLAKNVDDLKKISRKSKVKLMLAVLR